MAKAEEPPTKKLPLFASDIALRPNGLSLCGDQLCGNVGILASAVPVIRKARPKRSTRPKTVFVNGIKVGLHVALIAKDKMDQWTLGIIQELLLCIQFGFDLLP